MGAIKTMNTSYRDTKQADTIKTPVGVTDDVLLSDNSFDSSSSTLLTIPELAEFFKISPTSVRRLQQQRKLTFTKVGGSVRFFKEDVLSYVQKQRIGSIE